MRLVFWAAVAIIGYTYGGYAAWLWVRCHFRPRRIQAAPYLPSISIVLVVRNEESRLEQKLGNLLDLNYPAARTEILVVSDGSTDGTNRILSEFENVSRVRAIVNGQPRGKAVGLNDAIRSAGGEIVVFTDARQEIEINAVRLLMENFADPDVGCASGQLIIGDLTCGEAARGMGLYWKIEKVIRELESASGSVVGATGALYAVRRNFLLPLPEGTILDDVFIPIHVIRQEARVVFDSRARVWDRSHLGTKREFARKVRTLSGNYQLLQLEPWLLSSANPVRFEFISHKLLRLVVPFALGAVLMASFFLPGPIYRIALLVQMAFYGLSAWALVRPGRGPMAKVADASFTFVLLNAAAVVAFAHFVAGRKAAWVR